MSNEPLLHTVIRDAEPRLIMQSPLVSRIATAICNTTHFSLITPHFSLLTPHRPVGPLQILSNLSPVGGYIRGAFTGDAVHGLGGASAPLRRSALCGAGCA